MRRYLLILVGAVALLASAQSAQAQAKTPFVFLGAGPSLPTGAFGDYAKTGWLSTGGVGYNLTANFWIAAEGMYGSNKHKDITGDKTDLIGADANIGYLFGQEGAKMSPYLTGGAGILNHKFTNASGFSDSESKAMFYGGAGVLFPMGKLGIWIEARYVKRGDTQFIPVMAGVSINLGKK